MNDSPETLPEPPDPVVTRRRRSISLVWLVPIVAALIGASMLVHAWLATGPKITISFRTAEGLEAGKTPVKYKDVTVGAVTAVNLNDDGSGVVATVELVENAASLARADTRFWVVRPRVGLGGISGVDTLLSGAYIGVDKGSSIEPARQFTGLETPPTVIGGTPGKTFVLEAQDLGSLDINSPVYFRRIQVGRVASYQLSDDGKSVRLQIFVDAPYDRFVTDNTRFWNASGVDVSLGADGFKLRTQSVATVVAGGIVFAAPARSPGDPAADNTEFTLSGDQETAMAPPDGPAQYLQLRFDQSMRGLSVGAPVLFSGVDLGKVVSVSLDYDPATQHFPTVVGIVVYPQRLGRVLDKLPKPNGDSQSQAARFLADMVVHGLRAQARSGNLLTGQLYISLDFVSNAPKVAFDASARLLTLPTVNGDFDRMQEQIANIIAKIEKMPLDSIGKHLDDTLAGLDTTLKQVNGRVLPETTHTLRQAGQTLGSVQSALAEDGPLQQNLNQTLTEVRRTARSLRVLTDQLGRHPESVLSGRPDDASSGDTPAPFTSTSGPARGRIGTQEPSR